MTGARLRLMGQLTAY